MISNTYNVTIDGTVVARGMPLHTATLLVRAIFEDAYNEDGLAVTIAKDQYDIQAQHER